MKDASICSNCGKPKQYKYIEPIDAELKRTWGISSRMAKQFNRREGSICVHCGINIRGQGLAQAILNSKFGYGKRYLEEWVEEANRRKLVICELNSCHNLHQTLSKLKMYTYAEYGTKTEQNIEKMTYKEGVFDLFLHSETLEHVSDVDKAMSESRRVINNKGLILFSVPVVWNSKTRNRAKITVNKIKYLMEPSYHGKRTDDYLVFHEYGSDIDEVLGVLLAYEDWRNQNYIFESNKYPSRIPDSQKMKYKLLEKTALYLPGGLT